ncbi:heme oxygenase-domain-containing protein [Dichotomocladium elegans]|nr:heme oxygenase-domain-containing protein [Dichotomocladium elegans]
MSDVPASSVPFPHPGIDHLANPEELKRQCPAFAAGCPYAKTQDHASSIASFGEVSKCPAFQKGCPFSNKSKEEVEKMFADIPADHPPVDMEKAAATPEGAILVQMLNQLLSETTLAAIFGKNDKPQYLEDPQLAAHMRKGTMAAHKAAENSVFTKRFLKGEINRDEYGCYLTSLYFVYRTMERLLEKHKDNAAIKVIYFPHELNRQESLLKDLKYYYGEERLAQVTDPAKMAPAVREYVEAMESACAKDPSLLVAHSYSRYLGDLSGGQILAKRLKKHVLGLSEADGTWDSDDGLAFYVFKNIGNQNEFKNEYRERLNMAPVTKESRDLIVQEAIHSFELNIALFDEIQRLSEEKALISTKKEGAAYCCNNIALSRWPVALATTAAVVGVGAVVYARYWKRS